MEIKRIPGIVHWYFKQAIWKSPDDKIWLTFDDGPDPVYTIRYLDLLNTYKIKAIFFLVGSKVTDENLITKIISSGHEIGWHGQDHIRFSKLSREDLLYQFRMKEKFEDTFNIRIKYFRFPYGSFRPYMLRIVDAFEMSAMFWSYMVHDYKVKSKEDLLNSLKKLRKSDILLYHDSSENSENAFTALEEFIRNSHLQFRKLKD